MADRIVARLRLVVVFERLTEQDEVVETREGSAAVNGLKLEACAKPLADIVQARDVWQSEINSGGHVSSN